jgi:hypothetical protein
MLVPRTMRPGRYVLSRLTSCWLLMDGWMDGWMLLLLLSLLGKGWGRGGDWGEGVRSRLLCLL